MDRLREIRNKHGKKQYEIAKLLNISRASYTKYETGDREPDFATLIILATYFNVTTDYLLGLSDDASPAVTKQEALSVDDVLKKSGIKKPKYINALRDILELMKKEENNDGVSDEILNGEYNPKQSD